MLDGRRRLNLRGTALADLPDDLSVGGQVKFREVSGVEPGEAEQPARATVQGRFCGQQTQWWMGILPSPPAPRLAHAGAARSDGQTRSEL